MHLRLAMVVGAATLLMSCSDDGGVSSGARGPDRVGTSGADGWVGRGGGEEGDDSRGFVSRGTDEFVNEEAFRDTRPPRAEVNLVDDEMVEMTLVNASVEAAAEAILGEALGLSYTVADEVEGKITIQTTGPIPKSALLDLFATALAGNGARLEQEGEAISIVAGTSGSATFRSVRQGAGRGPSIVVAPLEYISATEMAGLLEPLFEDGLEVVVDQNRNLLLLAGTPAQLESAIEALNVFDVDALEGRSVALVRLTAADPEDVVGELETIFEAETGGMLEGVIEFVPNSRLSSVLVITTRAEYLDRAQRWIRNLDRTAGQSRAYTEIYPLENRRAVEVAPILNTLLSGGEAAASGGGGDEASSDGEDAGSSSGSTSGGATVAADPDRNALIVRGLQSTHEEVRHLLADLDTRSRQVALEATIAEVVLNDEVALGVRWYFEQNGLTSTFSDSANGGVSSNFPGFSSLFSLGGNAQFVLNALAGVTDVRVISSPTLMVLDNKDAILQIGDQVPVATQTSTSSQDGDAPTVTSISYRDTGVILEVKPQIGSGGTLTLEISQEVSSVAATNTSGIDSPTIRQRQITTSVVLQDGATLALGGLVQEGDTVSDTGVPGLSRIPYLGSAFRNRETSSNRTELLILIRPRIIDSAEEASDYTEGFRGQLSAAGGLLQTGLGTPRHSADDILR